MTSISEIRITRLPEEAQITEQHFGQFDSTLATELPVHCVLLRNDSFGVNAGMRGRIGPAPASNKSGASALHPPSKSYAARLGVGDVPQSDAVAEVLESNSPDFKAGDWVVHTAPWRTHDIVKASALRPIEVNNDTPAQLYLTALGHTAFTAYVGMFGIGQVGADDTVYVSAAAGGVGSYACQYARLSGARVIGSAGSVEKIAYLRDSLGLDEAFNYKKIEVQAALADLAPEGLSLYYDNVGGAQLEAAIGAMAEHGRLVLCGMVSSYGQSEPAPGPRNLHRFIYGRLTMRGFTVLDHESLRPAFEAATKRWLANRELVVQSTVLSGLGSLPEGFCRLLRGDAIGRMVVRLDR